MAKDIVGDSWDFGALKELSTDNFWAWENKYGIGFDSNAYLGREKLVDFDKGALVRVGKVNVGELPKYIPGHPNPNPNPNPSPNQTKPNQTITITLTLALTQTLTLTLTLTRFYVEMTGINRKLDYKKQEPYIITVVFIKNTV